MKAYDVLEQASLLVSGTAPDESLKKAGVGLVNTILNDLSKKPIVSLSEDVSFSHIGGCTVLISGVAMLISLLQGDDASLSGFNEIYNSGRKRLVGNVSKIKNTLFGGGSLEI